VSQVIHARDSRLLRVLRRVRNGMLVFLAFLLVVTMAIPSADVWWKRRQIAEAVRGAARVRLEEYTTFRRLKSEPLAAADFHEVVEALPVTWQVGIPGLVMYCYVPHHRVVITDAQGRETTLGVCFGCNQLKLDRGGVWNAPEAWQQPLRALFLRHEVPIRERYTVNDDMETE